MKLSIIIVSYKSDNVINDCLLSIEKYNNLAPEEIEVIIVDNYIDSTLLDQLDKLRNKLSYCLKYIKNDINGGFGQGNNVGVSHSSGDLLLFLNPDTILIEPCFYSTVKKLKKSKSLIIGYTLVKKDLSPNDSYSIFPQFFIFNICFILLKKLCFYLPNRVSWLNRMIWPWGAAFALSKETFINAGKFDELMFLCNEEPDLLTRIPLRKVEILSKKIIHLEGHTVTSKDERFHDYLKTTEYYFSKYHYNWPMFNFYLTISLGLKKFFRR